MDIVPYAIQDTNGNGEPSHIFGSIHLLELSNGVYEYSPESVLLKIYDFGFEEKGFTAYMMAYDDLGNFYFIDGHNCLIIKADKNAILGTSSFRERFIVTEPGLIKSIAALRENILTITAIITRRFSYLHL